MRRVRVLVPLLAAIAMSPLTAAQQTIRRDGSWDVKMEMNVGGRAMETITHQCITKEQAVDPMNTMPGGPDAQRGCHMDDYKITGQTVVWTVTCDGPPPIHTKGDYLYKADSYVGTMVMVRGEQTITTKLTGTRLGDCTTPPPAPTDGHGGQAGRGGR